MNDNSRKLKVLHVLKSSVYSGAENVVITIIKHLEQIFDMVYVATDGSIRQTLEKEHVKYCLFSQFSRQNLKKVFTEQTPDIVHAHDFSATVLCASIGGGFRLISHLHYDPPWTRRWNLKTAVYRCCYRRIDCVLTVSENSFRNMVFAEKFSDKYMVMGNPVDGTRIRCRAQVSGEESDFCDLIFVGRLVEQKNPQRFIHLVAALRDRGWKDIKAWMLGSGEMEEECKDLVVEYGLQSHVKLKGFQENPYPFIKRARVLCITSRWEGFGLVAIEANMLGVPVVSTDNSGCSEIFGTDALEICRSDEEFLDRISCLLQSASEYELWRKRALERGDRFDNISKYMKKMAEIYKSRFVI